jgi:hypothetical protein
MPWSGKGEMLTQVERISKKTILGPRPELTFTSFGRHGGATESKSSGLTELQLMEKGQWSSTAAMGNYLHDDDEGKQEAQIKRVERRAKSAKQEARKWTFVGMAQPGLSEWKLTNPKKCLKTLERVKGIEPSYSAWKAAALPLSYTRARPINYHGRQAASTAISGFGPLGRRCRRALFPHRPCARRGP